MQDKETPEGSIGSDPSARSVIYVRLSIEGVEEEEQGSEESGIELKEEQRIKKREIPLSQRDFAIHPLVLQQTEQEMSNL